MEPITKLFPFWEPVGHKPYQSDSYISLPPHSPSLQGGCRDSPPVKRPLLAADHGFLGSFERSANPLYVSPPSLIQESFHFGCSARFQDLVTGRLHFRAQGSPGSHRQEPPRRSHTCVRFRSEFTYQAMYTGLWYVVFHRLGSHIFPVDNTIKFFFRSTTRRKPSRSHSPNHRVTIQVPERFPGGFFIFVMSRS